VPPPVPAPGAAPAGPSARQLRRHARAARRRSGTARPLGETLQDLYIALFSVLMLLVLVAPTAARVLDDAGRRSTDPALASALAVAALLAASAAALRSMLLVGPVVRDPADVTWLLSSPVARGRLLAPTAMLLLGVSVATGAVVGAGCGLVAGGGAPVVLAWTCCGATFFAVIAAGAVRVQRGAAANRRARATADVMSVAAGGLLVGALAGLTAALPSGALWALAVGAGAAAVGLGALLPRVLGRLRRSELVAGAGLALGVRATVTALDGSFVAETLRARRLLERAVVRRHRLAGRGLAALVVADVRRVARSPRALLLAAALVPVGWTMADLYGRLGAAAAVSLAAWGAAGQVSSGLRTVSRSGPVSRSLPFSDAELRGAHAVVPFVVALVVTAATTAVSGRPAWTALAAALVGTAAVLRTAAGRPPISWEVQASSPMGALPVGAVSSYLVGLDVALVTTVPLLLGAGPALGIGLPLAACVLLVRFNRRPA
jgi:hypothetical protein